MNEENKNNIKCRMCQHYKRHDYEVGYCTKYDEQRKQDNKCVIFEEWFDATKNN